jgi:clan AA aspartic protease (TIGR02281 family)
MSNRFFCFATAANLSILFFFLASNSVRSADMVSVSDELERLAGEHEFVVRGLEQTEESFGRAEGEKLYPRLRRLLENFDHVIVQSPTGGVDRVIVLGEKVPFEPPPPPPAATPKPMTEDGGDIVLETERRGTQHVVRVSLEGENGAKVERELHVDTGAELLVLPQSLLSALGIDKSDLDQRKLQTANGMVEGRTGSLQALWLGENRITAVDTAFIEDGKLGGNGLLGMSVLKRFKVTIDDEKNRITLGRRDRTEAAKERQAEEASAEDPGDKNP